MRQTLEGLTRDKARLVARLEGVSRDNEMLRGRLHEAQQLQAQHASGGLGHSGSAQAGQGYDQAQAERIATVRGENELLRNLVLNPAILIAAHQDRLQQQQQEALRMEGALQQLMGSSQGMPDPGPSSPKPRLGLCSAHS